MKLEQLHRFLTNRNRTKIFVLTDRFCLCGHASRAQDTPEGVRVRIASSVRFVFSTGEVICEEHNSGTLMLTDEHRVTRRLQTHRRHLEGRELPEEYFRLGHEL